MARQSRLNLGLADEISSVLTVYPWWTRRTRSVPDLSLMDQMHLVCPRWTRSVPDGADGLGLSFMDPSPLSAGPGGYGDGHKPGSAVTDRLRAPCKFRGVRDQVLLNKGEHKPQAASERGGRVVYYGKSLSSNLHARVRTHATPPPPPHTHTHVYQPKFNM